MNLDCKILCAFNLIGRCFCDIVSIYGNIACFCLALGKRATTDLTSSADPAADATSSKVPKITNFFQTNHNSISTTTASTTVTNNLVTDLFVEPIAAVELVAEVVSADVMAVDDTL